MQVQNNKEEVPFAHYVEKFRALDPVEAAARCGAAYENGEFAVTLLGTTYWIAWPEYTIRTETGVGFALENLPCQTFLLRFLLEGKMAGRSTGFKTFREMPWGEMYIGPYTGRCLTRAAFTFGTRVDAFAAACRQMGAREVPHGDASYEFRFLDEYRLRLIVWEDDDEFPPNAQLLYSANFEDGFAAEDRVVAGDLLITALKAKM